MYVKVYDDNMNIVGAKEFPAPSATIKVYDWEDLAIAQNTGQVTTKQGRALVHEILNGVIIYIKNAYRSNDTSTIISGFVSCMCDVESPDDSYVLTIPFSSVSTTSGIASSVFIVGEL